jgi:small-conductance mechanosensitive channel
VEILAGFDGEWPQFLQVSWVRNLIFSVLLIAVLVGLRSLVSRLLMRHLDSPEERQKWLSGSRNTVVLLLLFGLAAIWANAIQSFVLSLVAVAAAIVIATKELLLCLSGSFLRTTSGAYTLGDRIHWGPVHGDVIDVSLLSTTVLEVGPSPAFHMPTGRKVIIPNAKLLDTPVYNESGTGRYVVHTVKIPLTAEDDLERAQQAALSAIHEVCQDFLQPAREWMESLEHTHNFIHTPSATPRVYLHIPEPNRLDMLLRFPSPVRRQGRLEQAILRRFIRSYYGKQVPLSVSSSATEVI